MIRLWPAAEPSWTWQRQEVKTRSENWTVNTACILIDMGFKDESSYNPSKNLYHMNEYLQVVITTTA